MHLATGGTDYLTNGPYLCSQRQVQEISVRTDLEGLGDVSRRSQILEASVRILELRHELGSVPLVEGSNDIVECRRDTLLLFAPCLLCLFLGLTALTFLSYAILLGTLYRCLALSLHSGLLFKVDSMRLDGGRVSGSRE